MLKKPRFKPFGGASNARRAAAHDKLYSLELARFVAAFCVATNHLVGFTATLAGRPVLAGFDLPPITAVSFFFVLSGFVIGNAHAKDLGRWARLPHYVWRRLWRIYPVYLLSLAIPLYFLWRGCGPAYLAENFSLSPLVPAGFHELNPPAWSLRFEITFYALFGLILLPRIGRFVLAAWVFAVTWQNYPHLLHLAPLQTWAPFSHGLFWHLLNPQDFMFFAGLAAAYAFVSAKPRARLLWPMLAAAATALVCLVRLDQYGFAYAPPSRVIPEALGYAGLIFALAALEQRGRLRLGAWAGRLGAMSYPLYLFHPDIVFLGQVWLYRHPNWGHISCPPAAFAAMLAGALALSAAVTFLFDRPLQRLARRW